MNLNEKLITLVQPHPCLYDCRNKDFKNSLKKEILWEEISKELNENCDAIKTKWKNLKDGYTKYKKSMKCTSGKKKPYVNWVWGPYLTFLDSATQPRQMSCVVSQNSSEIYATENEEISRSPSLNEASVSTSPPPIAVISIDESLSSPNLPLPSTPLHSSRKRGSINQDDSFDKLLAYLSNKEEKDSIDLLFASYAKTLKKMKPRTQSTIKLQIAQIFAEAEIADQLLEQSENMTSLPSSDNCKSEP